MNLQDTTRTKKVGTKPRLGESLDEFWQGIYDSHNYWWRYGYSIHIDTLGDGVFSLDKDKKLIKVSKVGKIPVYAKPTRGELELLDRYASKDILEVWAIRMSKSTYSEDYFPDKLLHSPSGLSFNV